MRIALRSGLPAITVLAFLGCGPRATPLTPADIEANRALSQTFSDHVLARDWEAASQLYADSALLLPPNSTAIQGRTAIRDYLSAFPPLAALTVTADEVTGVGDAVYVTGRYYMTLALPGNPVDSGKFLDVRRKQADGSWKYVVDMFNTSVPLPAAP